MSKQGIQIMLLKTRQYSAQEIADLNRKYAYELGWAFAYESVSRLLGIYGKKPGPMEFGQAVADWQAKHGIPSTDGVISRSSWYKMRKLLPNAYCVESPLPIWLKTEVAMSLHYNVPLLVQKYNPICWVKSANMVELYYGRVQTDFTWGFSVDNSSPPDITIPQHGELLYGVYQQSDVALEGLYQNQNQQEPAIISQIQNHEGIKDTIEYGRQNILLIRAGFDRAFEKIEVKVKAVDIAYLLATRGPLLLAHDASFLQPREYHNDGEGMQHMVVITGIDINNKICFINDPGLGVKDKEIRLEVVLAAIVVRRRLVNEAALWYLKGSD